MVIPNVSQGVDCVHHNIGVMSKPIWSLVSSIYCLETADEFY